MEEEERVKVGFDFLALFHRLDVLSDSQRTGGVFPTPKGR